ncbi:MAG TPA: response regulator, partial [Candidatus Bathyarchaeia archaeon]
HLMAQALQTGPFEVMRKPFTLDELGAVLSNKTAPLSGAFQVPSGREPNHHSKNPSNDRHSGLNILLAEDNAVNQRLALRILEKQGHSVRVVSNGLEAVSEFENGHFDLILMDVQMPEMDGFEATNAIRGKEKATKTHVPIVAMTAHAMKGDRDLCLQRGMDEYIAKPINIEEFLEIIDRLRPADIGEEQKE